VGGYWTFSDDIYTGKDNNKVIDMPAKKKATKKKTTTKKKSGCCCCCD
jgi:hypothetical protein